MKVLMLVWTSVATDSRVTREARALVEAGHSVHIIGRAVPADYSPPPGITVGSVGQPPRSQARARRLSLPERAVRWALLPTHVTRRLREWQRECLAMAGTWADEHGVAHVVHAHDFTALPVGHELATQWGASLVYDTHEYWVGRPVEGRPAPLRRRQERRLESSLGREAAAVVTVGQGVADHLVADHPDWPTVTVVRNTFTSREPGLRVSSPPQGLLYAGRLAADRELEVIARASRNLPLPVILRGPADEQWLQTFDPASARVEPAVPIADLDRELACAGAALVTHSDRWANHRLALPNKVFHAVSVGVPVVATDVGELGALVRRYRLGTLYRPGDSQDLVRAVERLLADHAGFVASVGEARADLGWHEDAGVLIGLYEGLADRARPLD